MENRKMECWTRSLIIFIILLKLGNTIFISFVPGIDEAFQIQAGIRLSEGKGLTSSMDDISLIRLKTEKDLSKNVYNYLSNWAPLESIMIAIFNTLGLKPLLTVGWLHFMFFALGIIGWYKCINMLLRNKFTQFVCVCVLFCIFNSAAGTSMFTWAIFSYIVWIFLEVQKGEETFAHYIYLVSLSIISIYFRYQALAFALSVPVLIYILSKSRHKLLFSFISGLIIAGSYLALNIFNREMGVDLFSSVIFDFKKTDFTLLPKYLFILIPDILTGTQWLGNVDNVLTYFILPLILNVLFLFSIIFYRNKIRKNLYIIIPVFLTTFFLLFYTSMLGDFSTLIYGRYWWFLTPMFLIILLEPLDSFLESELGNKRLVKGLKTLTQVFLFILIIGLGSYWNYRSYKRSALYNTNKLQLNGFLDETVKKQLLNRDKLLIFTGMDDPKVLSNILLVDNKYATFRRLDLLKDEKLYFSGDEKILLMVDNKTEWEKYLSKNLSGTLLDTKFNYRIYRVDFINK